MFFAVGSLVKARGREWVVLPESENDFLVLRPLGGSDDEITGVSLDMESVQPASFALPDPSQLGGHLSCKLMRDAVRLGFRSSAGPFRSFGNLAVDPRPYQLVPLLMALKMQPVRLLIGDDVGIGKTIEAGLIARELIDRGEVERMTVLCPPHLAEQWQAELRDKFHIRAEMVLASTAARLERACGLGQSLFRIYPYTIVSLDFIKGERRRHEFINNCPELVIVDEAHTCAYSQAGRSSRHQRHQLLKDLAANEERHLILVTATPHSGNDEEFHSLISLLDPKLADLPADIRGKENEAYRRLLAQYFVQRRRTDIRRYLESDTAFPEREEKEESYRLHPEYRALFDRVLKYARESVKDLSGQGFRQRVQWWSALALLRALASSPAAAAATLRSRAAVADADNEADADLIGTRVVLDLDADENAETMDVIPGSDIADLAPDEQKNRRVLLEMARQAEVLHGEKDEKLKGLIKALNALLKEDYRPIVFCRFIATAEYLAKELRRSLRKVDVTAVTGNLPPAEREERIEELASHDSRVLVATDCMSEGINLQEHFDAVIHYDLSWNPTRQEQREGRVDRFGQTRPKVRMLTYYGIDNQIDGIVLDVLLRKHKLIRSRLGISLPVPVDSSTIIEAIFEGLLLRDQERQSNRDIQQGFLFDEFLRTTRNDVEKAWDRAADKEKTTRTLFAQATIQPDEVSRELESVRRAMGSSIDVAGFLSDAVRALGGSLKTGGALLQVSLQDCPNGLKDLMPEYIAFKARFDMPIEEGVLYLNRTHPVIESLGQYIMNSALDDLSSSPARRSGVIRTRAVDRRTTLLLVRYRYHIITRLGQEEIPLLAEDCQLLAFRGAPTCAEWLSFQEAETLLTASPDDIIYSEQARDFIATVVQGYEGLRPYLEASARQRGEDLLTAHTRVRQAARLKGLRYSIDPQLPPDLLGIYIFLPARGKGVQ
ncbi:MAG: helicase-related protein [Syntrophomonas sp.]